MFYYMLGNIDPKFRSTLRSIQLLTIANTIYIEKYGIDAILEPFMEDILKLEEVCMTLYMYMYVDCMSAYY